MSTRVAIQGGQASFHHVAANLYFGKDGLELCESRTFRQQCLAVVERRADVAVMAIENSLTGSILPNYVLLQRFQLHIQGEIYLRIKQNLMALPGQELSDIHTVRSHPIALEQCSDFLSETPQINCIESFDTAESAREIRESNLLGAAAIASALAAQIYKLTILAASIENVKQNYTRFLVLTADDQNTETSANKASLSFHVSHEVGALADILNIFRDHAINLGLIQSVPIPGRPDEYTFHVDVEWQDRNKFEQAMEKVRRGAKELTILGEYRAGLRPSQLEACPQTAR